MRSNLYRFLLQQSARLLPLAACLAIYLFYLSGSAWAAVSFPKPEGWVTDQAGLLDASTKNRIERLLTELERKSGVEIAVVTLRTLGGRTIEEVAVELFQAWGIGKKGKDEGLLLLVAQSERKLRIEVGYGLEGTIPDGLAGEIIRETITPRFRQGRFSEGIEAGAGQIVDKIAQVKHVELEIPQAPPSRPTVSRPEARHRTPIPQGTLIKLFMFTVAGLIIISMLHKRSSRGPRGRRRPSHRFLGFPVTPPQGGWSGGGFGSSGSGGFGGFGGGSSGGGGASGSW